jgi:hypothetical protein
MCIHKGFRIQELKRVTMVTVLRIVKKELEEK